MKVNLSARSSHTLYGELFFKLQVKPGTDLNQLVIRTSQWERVGVAALLVVA